MTVIVGDVRQLPLPDESVDAVITDAPYELAFMGRPWDRSGVAFDVAAWEEVFRVLKPGGRLLSFGGTRTHHRIWCAIEDAGFVIEDTIAWMHGSGFPKHRSKLKPGHEPICVARKGPVSDLNIDAARIGTGKDVPASVSRSTGVAYSGGVDGSLRRETGEEGGFNPNVGRWPANVALDEEAAAVLDKQSGPLASGTAFRRGGIGFRGGSEGGAVPGFYGDTGGASRFYYIAKATRAEREHGLEGFRKRPGGSTASGFTVDVANGLDRNRPVANNHPTVKPVALMRWLVRLVTQPGELVLDPFCGSGTTGVACVEEGRRFVGVELDPEYVEIARRRIGAAQPSLFGGAA